MKGITDGQRAAIDIHLRPFYGRDHACKMYLVNKIIGRGYQSTAEMIETDWLRFRDTLLIYQPFDDGETWLIKPEMYRQLGTWVNEYREKVLGQMRLF